MGGRSSIIKATSLLGKPKDPKPLKPGMRGEKWTLKDGSQVIVLEKVGRSGFIRCFGERGFTRVEHINNFAHREKSE
jgi:hypothetical protein